MKLVICDDDKGTCAKLEGWIEEYQRREKISLQVDVFYRSEELLDYMKKGYWFDAIFLDIEFDGLDGVELGRQIRKNSDREFVGIVYISAKTEYCQALFDMEPVNFHRKPLKREDIFRDLEKLVRRHSDGKQVVRYKEGLVTKGILLRDVVYMESVNRSLVIHTGDKQKIEIKGSISRMYESFRQYEICQCHRLFLVNLNYVTRYLDHKLYMKTGEEIPVGRKYVQQLKQAWMRYDVEE